MPAMRGDELAREILTRWPSTRVMFMTAYTDRDIVAGDVPLPEDAILAKPFTRDQLLARVAAILRAEPGSFLSSGDLHQV